MTEFINRYPITNKIPYYAKFGNIKGEFRGSDIDKLMNPPIEKVFLYNIDPLTNRIKPGSGSNISGQSLCPKDTFLVRSNTSTPIGGLGINLACVAPPLSYDPTSFVT